MLRVTTSGTPFEQGRQHGLATRQLVLPWMEQVFAEMGEPFEDSTLARVARWQDQMETLFPAGMEECRGLAAGLGVDEIACMALQFSPCLLGQVSSCTVLGHRDPQGRPLLGKTDDIDQSELGLNILETTRPDTGYRHAHFHFAGTLWTVAGANECGLAMGMTGIPGPEKEEEGLFSLMALPTILPSCADVEEAIAHIRALELNAYGFSLVLGDPQGKLALVEKTGAGTVALPEDTGFLVHTNHILDPEFAEGNPAQDEPAHTNGQRRYQRARHLLQAGAGIEQIIRDRHPCGPICQRGEDGLHTDFAVLFAPAEHRMRLWAGYPDEVPAEDVDLEDLFSP